MRQRLIRMLAVAGTAAAVAISAPGVAIGSGGADDPPHHERHHHHHHHTTSGIITITAGTTADAGPGGHILAW